MSIPRRRTWDRKLQTLFLLLLLSYNNIPPGIGSLNCGMEETRFSFSCSVVVVAVVAVFMKEDDTLANNDSTATLLNRCVRAIDSSAIMSSACSKKEFSYHSESLVFNAAIHCLQVVACVERKTCDIPLLSTT
mmetsp:Transcript_18878/g.30434  ORF Transcript_18878/g.30434 Transcript_18878/m.30434 type:complete len:133 (-) Transcript_18878:208-606(-)